MRYKSNGISSEYNCLELKVMMNRQQLLFDDRKKPLVKFRDMYEAMNNITTWCESAVKHLEKETNQKSEEETPDMLSELRQLEYLVNESEDIKIRGREHFEENYVEIKDLISEKTLIKVDEHINKLEEVKNKVCEKRDELRKKCEDERLLDDDNHVEPGSCGNISATDNPDK